MYYLEHCLHEAGVTSASAIALLRTTDLAWAYEDLRAELRDLFLVATVTLASPDEAPRNTDLAVAVFTDAAAFPLQDVSYRHLPSLSAWAAHLPGECPVVLYRTSWRDVEVVRAGELARLAWRKRLERAAVEALGRGTLLRRFLLPLY